MNYIAFPVPTFCLFSDFSVGRCLLFVINAWVQSHSCNLIYPQQTQSSDRYILTEQRGKIDKSV